MVNSSGYKVSQRGFVNRNNPAVTCEGWSNKILQQKNEKSFKRTGSAPLDIAKRVSRQIMFAKNLYNYTKGFDV